MTILFSLLGIHVVNVLFIFFTFTCAVRRNGLNNAINFPYLIFLFCHPLSNLLCLYSIFRLGDDGLDEIVKNKIGKE